MYDGWVLSTCWISVVLVSHINQITIYSTTLVICWVVTFAKYTRCWGVGGFFAIFCVMGSSAFYAIVGFPAVCFTTAIVLAACTLYNTSFSSRRLNFDCNMLQNSMLNISLLFLWGSKSTKCNESGSLLTLCFTLVTFLTLWPCFSSSSFISEVEYLQQPAKRLGDRDNNE
jgi:hypothetical protein